MIEFINENGIRYLKTDYSGIKDEKKYLELLDETVRKIKNEPKGSVKLLGIYINSAITIAVKERMKKLADECKEYMHSHHAVVSGMQKIIALGIKLFTKRKNIYYYDNIEDAKKGLLSS